MDELRREWTPEEAADRAPDSDERLAEAMRQDRRPAQPRTGGAEHQAGEEEYVETQGAADGLVPPDPPRQSDAS